MSPSAERGQQHRSRATDEEDPAPRVTALGQAGLRLAEDVIYLSVAALLAIGAGALLVQTVFELVSGLPSEAEEATKAALDTVLLVFILVELLGAVRSTLKERKLLAEPFLIVGMIASIKEIVIVGIDAKDLAGTDPAAFDSAMLQIGVLGGLLVALALAMFLSRLKEREPEE